MKSMNNENNIFLNPYDAPKARERGIDLVQVTCPVYKNEVDFFRLIRPTQGTITGIIGLMWRKLYQECNERQINDYSSQGEFEQFIAGARLVSADEWAEYRRLRGRGLPDGTAGGTLPQPAPSHVGCGEAQSRNDDTTNAAKLSNVQGRSRTKRGGHRQGEETKAPGQGQ